MLIQRLTTFFLVSFKFSNAGTVFSFQITKYLGGIPVPGRSVPALRIFELYAKSCEPNDRNVDANNLASNLYNSLYMAAGDTDVTKLMGKWFLVIDTPGIHHERCPIFYFKLLDKTLFTATFTVRQYSRNSEHLQILEGYGRKIGPDPAELLINIGHVLDPCPFVRNGPVNTNDQYDYVILTQPLKYPTVVLARDPLDFNRKYRKQVEAFLEKENFWNPSAPRRNNLYFVNTTNCFTTNQYNIGF
ncbi:unnamed protein product [Thelazia callipaeda]|uniref:Lipocalin/cytosolic fatty-acid binding domain-containing protein n=1 Tax=Thelazia callipaeda TaxID=103827 RepID=A0A0N5CN60_THECL|nr:unnamed protein product [Thelazia callipaeda]